MKKTLTMLLAAVGAVYAQDDSNEVIFSQSWTSAGPADTNSTVNSSFYYGVGMDYAIIGTYQGNAYKPWQESLSNGTSSFTLSFDLTNIDVMAADSPWDDIFSMKLSDSSKLQFQITDTGTLTLFNTNSEAQIDTTLTLDDFDNWQTLTLIGDAKAGKLSIYLGGTCVASTADNAWTGSAVTDIQFGAEFAPTGTGEGADRVPNGAFGINNIALSNGVAVPTPEPATATLSLLALAGLCARRRRK